MSLTNHEKQALIAKAHPLHPIIIIGNDGLTAGVLAEIDRALYDHELIKIRLRGGEKSEKEDIIQNLSHQLNAACLKVIGHIAIVYRVSDKKQKMNESGSKPSSSNKKKPSNENGKSVSKASRASKERKKVKKEAKHRHS